jgi:hypothetical protein
VLSTRPCAPDGQLPHPDRANASAGPAGPKSLQPRLLPPPLLIETGRCTWHTQARRREAVENDIGSVIAKFIPEKDRDGLILHATELFSGGKYFDRINWRNKVRHLWVPDAA